MKRLLCCVLTAVLLFSITACGSDADVIGSWEQELELSILGTQSIGSVRSVVRYTFREDGTGMQEQIVPDGSYPDIVREYTYRLDGNTITLNFGENHTEQFTVTSNKTSLKLENRRGIYNLSKVE